MIDVDLPIGTVLLGKYRVDAVLGASVFEHLFKLPPRYFEHRPTGVIAARLRGVETIREFVASAAVTLILDLPFLLVFVAIMLYYSVSLTLISVALIGLIVGLSLIMAPIFRAPERPVSARRPQSGLHHRVHRGTGDRQKSADGTPA